MVVAPPLAGNTYRKNMIKKAFDLALKSDTQLVDIAVTIELSSDGITIAFWEGNSIGQRLVESLDLATEQAPIIPQKPTQFWCGVLISHWLNQAAINYGSQIILQSVSNPNLGRGLMISSKRGSQ